MSYVNGFKVDDLEKLAAHNVDVKALVVNITRAFAQQVSAHTHTHRERERERESEIHT